MNALVQVLNQEEQYFQCLVQLQQQLQDCLIHNRSHEIEPLVQQQDKCLQIMQQCEQERLRQLQPWGANLSLALEQAPDLKTRTQLKVLQQKINRHIQQLRHLRHANQALLEQGMAYIQYSTELYRSLACAGSASVYSPHGQVQIASEPVRSFYEYDA